MRAGAMGLVMLLCGECTAISFDMELNGYLEKTGEPVNVGIHFYGGHETELECEGRCRKFRQTVDVVGYTESGVMIWLPGCGDVEVTIEDYSWLDSRPGASGDTIYMHMVGPQTLNTVVDGNMTNGRLSLVVSSGKEEWIRSFDFLDVPTLNAETFDFRWYSEETGEVYEGTRHNRACLTTGVGCMVVQQFQIVHKDLKKGDSNADGRFDQKDLVQVAMAGRYMTGTPAAWSQGDWDADGYFDQFDFVVAMEDGKYRGGVATMAVPEPEAGVGMLVLTALVLMYMVLGCIPRNPRL